MKKLLFLLFLIPIVSFGQVNLDLNDIVQIVEDSDIDAKILSKFNGFLKKKDNIFLYPHYLESKVYGLARYINFFGGQSHHITIYRDDDRFVQAEFTTIGWPPSLELLKKQPNLKYIKKIVRPIGSKMAVDYLFSFNGYAVNVITLKESESFEGGYKNGVMIEPFTLSTDDIVTMAITDHKYFNDISSQAWDFKF
jgi:hypothetical protein